MRSEHVIGRMQTWLRGNFPKSVETRYISKHMAHAHAHNSETEISLKKFITEIYPKYVMLSMFGNHIPNSNVLFYCDNSSVCQIINKQSSKHPFIMKIVRSLFLLLVKYNIHLKCRHIPGINNTLCDKISRFQITNDVLMIANMNKARTNIPDSLLPRNFAETCIEKLKIL